MPPPQRSRVTASPPIFHLRMRLLTSRGAVGAWAGHVFRVEIGPSSPAATRVYGVVGADGTVDARLPGDWETATLDVGEPGQGGGGTPGELDFGVPRLTIPLRRVELLGPPSPAQAAVRLVNLGYLDDLGAASVSASTPARVDTALAHAIRGYVFRQTLRSPPVRGDLFDQLRRALAPGEEGDRALVDPAFLQALVDHLRAVHDDPQQVP